MDDSLSPAPRAQFVPTPATTLDELVKNAFFVASNIDAPAVEVVNPHAINLHYSADGSLATVRIEARPGAWGGIGIKAVSLEQEDQMNAHYDAQKAAAAAPPVEPPPPPPVENPVYEVQRQ